MNLKHINDLVIGDEVIIQIPNVCSYTSTVVFINKELMFIFLEGNEDSDDGIKFIPDKNGFYKVP